MTVSLPFSKKIRKNYNHLGFKTNSLIGIFILSMFLAYSIEYLYIDYYKLITTYYPNLTFPKNLDIFLNTYYIKEYLLNNFINLTLFLFCLQVVFFQNNKLCFKNNKVVWFIDQTLQKMSLLIPIKQFSTFMLYSHLNQIGSTIDKFHSDFSTPIVLTSFIVSTLIISIVPTFMQTISKWKRNNLFALNSGLVFHYKTVQELEMDYEFKKFIDNLGELKVIKIAGITGKHTFIDKNSYMHIILDTKHLKKSNKPTFKLLLSKEGSKGLEQRARGINTSLLKLNEEIIETKNFIYEHDVLSKHVELKQYTTLPKYKMILLEGKTNKIVMLQAYLDRYNILDEQVYIYEDKDGTSIYKILSEQYDDLYKMIR